MEKIDREMRTQGYLSVHSKGALEAIQVARAGGIELVIVDIRTPQWQGAKLLVNLKKFCPILPVILLSDNDPKLLEAFYQAGADAILFVPLEGDLLKKTVLRFMEPERKGEFRIHPRYKASLKISWRLSEMSQSKQSTVLNLSGGGLFILENHFPPKKTDIINFRLDYGKCNSKSVSGKGLVRWIRTQGMGLYPNGFGIEFISVKGDLHNLIHDFLRN